VMKKILLLILLVLPVSSQAYTYAEFQKDFSIEFWSPDTLDNRLAKNKANNYLSAMLRAYNYINLIHNFENSKELFCGLSDETDLNLRNFNILLKAHIEQHPFKEKYSLHSVVYDTLEENYNCKKK